VSDIALGCAQGDKSEQNPNEKACAQTPPPCKQANHPQTIVLIDVSLRVLTSAMPETGHWIPRNPLFSLVQLNLLQTVPDMA
jgi:hypothetical protein